MYGTARFTPTRYAPVAMGAAGTLGMLLVFLWVHKAFNLAEVRHRWYRIVHPKTTYSREVLRRSLTDRVPSALGQRVMMATVTCSPTLASPRAWTA